jgi:hypothetical protein
LISQFGSTQIVIESMKLAPSTSSAALPQPRSSSTPPQVQADARRHRLQAQLTVENIRTHRQQVPSMQQVFKMAGRVAHSDALS